MEENKYNLDNTKNCISDGNNTLIITYQKKMTSNMNQNGALMRF